MQSQALTNQNQAQINQKQNQTIVRIEVQLDQLAASVGKRENGQFPSQSVPNLKGQNDPQNVPKGQFKIGSSSNREVQAIHFTIRQESEQPSPSFTKQSQ